LSLAFCLALLSQFEVVTLNLLGNETDGYGKVRLWGSIGFILAVVGGGWVLDSIGLKHWPVITLVILSLVVLTSLFVRCEQQNNLPRAEGSMFSLLKNKQIIAFFIILFLIQASHGPYYSFFSISLHEMGFTETGVGLLWSLGVIAEIVLFMLMQRILKFVSLRNVLLISILLTTVRWLIMAWFLDNMAMLIIAQILHAVSFGAFHLVGIQFIHKHFTGVNQTKGQALYSSVGFGVGGMCGSLIAGYFWELIGHEWVFTIAAGLSVLALYVAWQWVHFHNFTNKIIIEVGRS
jgi:PPP family 3-phenylpropionic acid transporter